MLLVDAQIYYTHNLHVPPLIHNMPPLSFTNHGRIRFINCLPTPAIPWSHCIMVWVNMQKPPPPQMVRKIALLEARFAALGHNRWTTAEALSATCLQTEARSARLLSMSAI